MSPRWEVEDTCPHPESRRAVAEAWGPLGPFLRAVRCRDCGATL